MDEGGGSGGEDQRDRQMEETAGDEPGTGHGKIHDSGERVAGIRIHAVQRRGEDITEIMSDLIIILGSQH